MGLYIKKSNKGIRIFHSVSDEPIHDDYLTTVDEVKAVLVERALFKFYEEVIKIDADYINNYYVNGKLFREKNGESGTQKMLEIYQSDNAYELLESQAREILKRLDIKL